MTNFTRELTSRRNPRPDTVMPLFQSSPPSQHPNSSLRLPASRRISTPSSQRLTTITEGQNANTESPPPVPRRSSKRNSASASHGLGGWSKAWAGTTEGTQRTAPPPYDWVPDPTDSRGEDSNLTDDEKLERLRRGEGEKKNWRRGGWVRLAIIIGVVLLVIVALAVGLGVGLTRKKNSSSNQGQSSTASPGSSPPQKFPLGKYSLVTALKTEEYACTTNPNTWLCYPYTAYSPSTNQTSLASFNWIISNTSSMYATSSTPPTPEEGISANLTVSTTNNPFSITFANKPLTYISPSTNTSSSRYTFSFTLPKKVVPSVAITPDGAATECFFNETVFTGTLYLSASRTYPSTNLQDSTSLGGYAQWPHAVEITQMAYGGTDVPNCYYTTDGVVGDRTTYGLDPTLDTSSCLCDYRNY